MKIIKTIEAFAGTCNPIELCNECKGHGWKWSSLDFGDIPGDEKKLDCSVCEGTGRVKGITLKVRAIVPFDFDE